MAELLNGVPQDFSRGSYVVNVNIGTGTASLSYIVDGLPSKQIEDASWSASADKLITLPKCEVTATLTGDARISVSPV